MPRRFTSREVLERLAGIEERLKAREEKREFWRDYCRRYHRDPDGAHSRPNESHQVSRASTSAM